MAINLYTSCVKAVVLDRVVLILSFVGLFISGALSMAAYLHLSIPCGLAHGCDKVATHPTSHLIGDIPNACFGFLGYAILAFLAAGRLIGFLPERLSLVLGYVVSGIGALASIGLMYIAFAVIQADCIWCMASAATMILLFVGHAIEMQLDAPAVETQKSSMNPILLGGCFVLFLLAMGFQYVKLQGSTMLSISQKKLNEFPQDQLLPPDAHIWGNPEAPITIVEFGDLLCGACRADYPIIKDVVMKSNGHVKYSFRQFPMYTLEGHANSLPAAMIAEVAADTGKFWQFVDGMYASDPEKVEDLNYIYQVAEGLGLDRATLEKRIQDPKDPAFLRGARDKQDGTNLGVQGTPAFFIVAPGVERQQTTAQSLASDLASAKYAKFFN